MSTLTRPTWFRPRECTLALRKSGLQFVSPFNGTMQAIDTLAERWVMNLAMPGAADGGARSAFFNQWAGGVNHVPLYHFGRPQPLGSLCGAPTLASATARGDSSLSLAGCRGDNALLGGSFETDSNADGIADGWARYTSGTTGTLYADRATDLVTAGSWGQVLTASALGATASDRHGLFAGAPVAHLAGVPVTLAVNVGGTPGTTIVMAANWFDSSGTIIDELRASVMSPSVGQLLQVTGVCPANAATVLIYLWQESGPGGNVYLYLDAARLVRGASSASYPGAATLQAGDMIGDGTQLYMVASDCTATDAGAMTVPIVNRARGVVASGTVVQWDRPTAPFALPAMEQSTTWLRGGSVDGMLLDAVEVY